MCRPVQAHRDTRRLQFLPSQNQVELTHAMLVRGEDNFVNHLPLAEQWTISAADDLRPGCQVVRSLGFRV